jgi:hypothetical protein
MVTYVTNDELEGRNRVERTTKGLHQVRAKR